MIDFIGLGAQKSGTSWVYACLYEHPAICCPVKEIHFFSRQRFSEGTNWYEAHWQRCTPGKVRGEFSTSYLYSTEAPERIASLYPTARLVAIVRDPVARAYSQYRNAIKGGEVSESMSFTEYQATEPSCLEQGLYSEQLARYYNHFSREQLLVLVYEDIARDPQRFMSAIYRHMGVDASFVPPSLLTHINVARTPKNFRIDKQMHYLAEWLRRHGGDTFVHLVKRSGLSELIRRMNTKSDGAKKAETPTVDEAWHARFKADTAKLSEYIGRDMVSEWRL